MKHRPAHSLIEMLVVLVILGVLLAIALPAFQRMRETARQTQCADRQGQLAKAVGAYVAAEPLGRYPGFRAWTTAGATKIGWAPQVFEYLGRDDLPQDPAAASNVELLVCPGDFGAKNEPRLSYVVNGGQPGTDSTADGIFFDHAKPLAERVYITNADFKDGLSNTILLAENLDATYWNATQEADQCILWPLVPGSEINQGAGPRPSSHHPGGFVAAFADASVAFIAASAINNDPSIYTADSIYSSYLTPGGDDGQPPE